MKHTGIQVEEESQQETWAEQVEIDKSLCTLSEAIWEGSRMEKQYHSMAHITRYKS